MTENDRTIIDQVIENALRVGQVALAHALAALVMQREFEERDCNDKEKGN